VEYARDFLAMHNLYCSIQADNLNSLKLFESVGFDRIGVRKDWFLYKGQRIDEISYQLCLKK
jgi:diamine N-acetyltransferase